MAISQESGSDFENEVADKLREANFRELNKNNWCNKKAQHSRCFTKQFVSGCGLYGKRIIDFRVKDGCVEFDLEAKTQSGSGTADVIAWVALELADRNKFPLYLVIGGDRLLKKCRSELERKAASSCYVLGVGTLEEFVAELYKQTRSNSISAWRHWAALRQRCPDTTCSELMP